MPSLTHRNHVFILNLGDGENRFNGPLLDALEPMLDEVEAAKMPRALVTCAEGKFWSTGLDLEWMGAQGEQAAEFVTRVHELLARFLSMGVPTIAAIQGHAFAAGAMLALAHDQRVMRADRGFFCLPEIDIRIPFTPGMSELIAARLPRVTAHEAMTTGHRYGGEEALDSGIVQEAPAAEDVLQRAIARANELAGKDGATLATIKRRLYGDVLRALRSEQIP